MACRLIDMRKVEKLDRVTFFSFGETLKGYSEYSNNDNSLLYDYYLKKTKLSE